MKTVYIIIAFCIGLFLGHVFFPTEKTIRPHVNTELESAKQQFASLEGSYTSYVRFYKRQNESLQRQLNNNHFLLNKAQEDLATKRGKTIALENRIKLDTLFRADTVLLDSLYESFASANVSADSLIGDYRQRDSLLETMVAVRDSQIVMCNTAYQEVSNLAKEQLLREQKLTDDLNTIIKQQKSKRFQNKLLAAGMLFVSGIATTVYISSKK